MNSIKLLAAVAALGLFATPAIAQSTNTMGNTMDGMGNGSMMMGSMDKGMSSKPHMMPMRHMAMSKKTMAACHKMSHARMMKSHQCRGLMKNGKMIKHAM